MLKVGLTGGLACGKSFLGEALAGMGCHLISADELGHAVLLPGGEAYHDVIREFGPGILDEDGRIDRRRLAAEVFGRPERLAVLNAMVHPHVFRRENEMMDQVAARDPHGIVVVEAAILIETGSYRGYDRVILVTCAEDQQLERAMRRDGATVEEVRARLSRQMPLEEKKKYADFIVDTSGTKEDTLVQARKVFESLRRMDR